MTTTKPTTKLILAVLLGNAANVDGRGLRGLNAIWGSSSGWDNLHSPQPPTPAAFDWNSAATTEPGDAAILQCFSAIEAVNGYGSLVHAMQSFCNTSLPVDSSQLSAEFISTTVAGLTEQCRTEVHSRCQEARTNTAGAAEVTHALNALISQRANAGMQTGQDASEFEVSIRGKGGGSSCPKTQNAGHPSQGSDRLAVCLQYPYQKGESWNKDGCYTNLFKDGCRVSGNEGRPAFTGSDRCSAQCNKHGYSAHRAACRKGCEFMACSSDWAVRSGCKLSLPVHWNSGVADLLFTSYRGQWNPVGQAVGQKSFSATTSWSTSTAQSVSSQFSVGLEVSASAGFFGVDVSTTASTEWSRTSERTVQSIQGGSATSTCGSITCTGNLWQWALVGTRRDGGQETMQQCSFVCVHSDSSAAPKCPSRYCASKTGDESNTLDNCQCCNSHCWAPNSQLAKSRVCPRLSHRLNEQCPSGPSGFSFSAPAPQLGGGGVWDPAGFASSASSPWQSPASPALPPTGSLPTPAAVAGTSGGNWQCYDTRQRWALGWVYKGVVRSGEQCQTKCAGFSKISLECPESHTGGFHCFCVNNPGTAKIPAGNCQGQPQLTHALNRGSNGHCNGPSKAGNFWVGGWHRGAVYDARGKQTVLLNGARCVGCD